MSGLLSSGPAGRRIGALVEGVDLPVDLCLKVFFQFCHSIVGNASDVGRQCHIRVGTGFDFRGRRQLELTSGHIPVIDPCGILNDSRFDQITVERSGSDEVSHKVAVDSPCGRERAVVSGLREGDAVHVQPEDIHRSGDVVGVHNQDFIRIPSRIPANDDVSAGCTGHQVQSVFQFELNSGLLFFDSLLDVSLSHESAVQVCSCLSDLDTAVSFEQDIVDRANDLSGCIHAKLRMQGPNRVTQFQPLDQSSLPELLSLPKRNKLCRNALRDDPRKVSVHVCFSCFPKLRGGRNVVLVFRGELRRQVQRDAHGIVEEVFILAVDYKVLQHDHRVFLLPERNTAGVDVGGVLFTHEVCQILSKPQRHPIVSSAVLSEANGKVVPLVFASAEDVQNRALDAAQARTNRGRLFDFEIRNGCFVGPKGERLFTNRVRLQTSHRLSDRRRRERFDRHFRQVIRDMPGIDGDVTIHRPAGLIDSKRLAGLSIIMRCINDSLWLDQLELGAIHRIDHLELELSVPFFRNDAALRLRKPAKTEVVERPFICFVQSRDHTRHHLGRISTPVTPES